MDIIPENAKVTKYGTKRMSIPVPKELEDEISVGDKCQIFTDRRKKALVVFFPDSDIKVEEAKADL